MNPDWDSVGDGLDLKAVYGPDDLAGLDHLGGMPGEAPFVRGPYRTMYRGRPWTIRQYAGYGDAAASNRAFREALGQGAQGLSVAFDLPTHRGYDSDDPEAAADIGMAGVAIDSVEDMRRLFEGIPLDRVSVSMTMSGAVLPVLAAFLVAAEESGVSPDRLRGTIQNDILKEFMVRNTWIHAPQPSLRIAADVVQWLARHAPKFNGMSISGYHFQEAGADPVLELALTLANARAYVGELRKRGLDIDAFCGGLSFFFGVGKQFYVEIAKLRAARLLWHDIVREMGGTTARATAMRMHCQTSGWTLAAQQPYNNIARTTIEAMAAVFGGTQSLHTNGFDEALALPSAEASRLARDTQLILQHEFGLCEVADPWAGSYMIESLTGSVVKSVRALLVRIEAQGGILPAVESGWVQRRIHRHALRTQARIDAGEAVVVGVNRYRDADGAAQECLEIDGNSVRVEQTRRLASMRARRNDEAVRHALAVLTDAAQCGDRNLLACAIEAMRCRATVGECTRALLRVWPRYAVRPSFEAAHYGAARAGNPDWAAACERVRALHAALGRAPRILLGKLGHDGHDRGAKAVAAALVDAGFGVRLTALFQSAESLALAACEEDYDAIGISTLGGAHLAFMPLLLEALRQRRANVPVFVGGIIPPAHRRALQLAGVRDIYGPGTPMETIVNGIAAVLRSQDPFERSSLQARSSSPIMSQ